MGFDTRYWGPSAWQLFHLIAFRSEFPDDVLNAIKDILPCKFCRASTTAFVREHPLRVCEPSGRCDPGKWLYDIHNRVNAKLRHQSEADPSVVNPGEDPTFASVKARYMAMKPTHVPGREFLFVISANYPEPPAPTDMAIHRQFLHALAKAYPFQNLRKVVANYIQETEPTLESRHAYMHWMYGLLSHLSDAVGKPMPTYRGFAHRVAYYRSGCSKKTYHGKTCRTLAGGGRTKNRNHRKTYRISHANLL